MVVAWLFSLGLLVFKIFGSGAHWLCEVMPCPATTSMVYQRDDFGTSGGNCFMDSEQLASVVISQCSSFCLRKGCAMMSYDRGKFILDVRLNVLGNFILCGNCPRNELKL